MRRGLWRSWGAVLLAGLLLSGCDAGGAGQVGGVEPPSISEPGPVEEGLPAAAASASAEEPVPRLTEEQVERCMEAVMEDFDAAGVSVAVIQQGEPGACAAWGWAVKGEREMTPDTKVRAASLSKVVLGMCAVAMEEDGMVDLDAPLEDYWGEGVDNPYREAQPTLRTLLTHTSSLRDLETTRGLERLRGLLRSASAWRDREPGDGSSWLYSNFGFCVLGTTLELASGQLLDDYLQARFLEPMGLRASLHAGRLEAEEVACLYNAAGGVERGPGAQTGQQVPQEIGLGASYFPGGLTISAVDLAKLVALLADDGLYEERRYLEAASVASMEQEAFVVEPENAASFSQCLALRRQEDLMGREALYYHTGSSYGVHALLSYDPNAGDGVVVLTTGTDGERDERGLYTLCARLSQLLYERMEAEEA